MKRLVVLGFALSLIFAAAPARSADVPTPEKMMKQLSVAPVTVTVAEPHFGAQHRSYVAFPARLVLDKALGENWNAPGAIIRLKALDGYASVIAASDLTGPDAFLAFGMADGSPFMVNNALQNETDIPLGPWYLVWDNIRNPALLKDGAVIWPYQVNQVEVAEAGDDQLFPAGLDERYRTGGKLVQVNCITCHKVNGYGGDKLAINLADVVKDKTRDAFLKWVLSPRTVKADTTMPGLPVEWPEPQRQQAAEAMYDYLAHVPVLP